MPQKDFGARLLCFFVKDGTDRMVVVDQGVRLARALGRMYLEERSDHKVGYASIDSQHIYIVMVTTQNTQKCLDVNAPNSPKQVYECFCVCLKC